MYREGAVQTANILSERLLLDGFRYEDLEKIIKSEFKFFTYDTKEYQYYEDLVLYKIEQKSKYVKVEFPARKKVYYYRSVKELSDDTGISVPSLNASIIEGWMSNGMIRVKYKYFTSSELSKNKRYMFEDKIGKLPIKNHKNTNGKYMIGKLKVTDTLSGEIKIYETGRDFITEMNMPIYNLSKYIKCNYKYNGRYKIEYIGE